MARMPASSVINYYSKTKLVCEKFLMYCQREGSRVHPRGRIRDASLHSA